MNELDPINERMRTVGNLAEAMLRVKGNEAAVAAIDEAIRLLLFSVAKHICPEDILYTTPVGIA